MMLPTIERKTWQDAFETTSLCKRCNVPTFEILQETLCGYEKNDRMFSPIFVTMFTRVITIAIYFTVFSVTVESIVNQPFNAREGLPMKRASS